MSKKRKPKSATPPKAQKRPEPRLYLFTPPLAGAEEDFPATLDAVLGEADVACVLAQSASAEPAALRALLLNLAPVARKHGAALLCADPDVAKAAGADGAHTRGAGAPLEAALSALKPDFIVGASGIHSRHDCMEAGERDIDYLMFGDPAPDGWRPPFEDTLERVAWWAEIFNVPCVAYAGSLDEIDPLVMAGADFIALGAAIWGDPRGPVVAIRQAEDMAIAAMADQ